MWIKLGEEDPIQLLLGFRLFQQTRTLVIDPKVWFALNCIWLSLVIVGFDQKSGECKRVHALENLTRLRGDWPIKPFLPVF